MFGQLFAIQQIMFLFQWRIWFLDPPVLPLHKNNMIMISRRAFSNTTVTKLYLTNKIARNVPKFCANRVFSPTYNIRFRWINKFFISARNFILIYWISFPRNKSSHYLCTPYLQEFCLLLLNNQRVVMWLVMVSQNYRVFYSFRSNRNLVATKFLLITELISCIRPFVFYDSYFDSDKSNHSPTWQNVFGIYIFL